MYMLIDTLLYGAPRLVVFHIFIAEVLFLLVLHLLLLLSCFLSPPSFLLALSIALPAVNSIISAFGSRAVAETFVIGVPPACRRTARPALLYHGLPW